MNANFVAMSAMEVQIRALKKRIESFESGSAYQKLKNELSGACRTIQQLKEEIMKFVVADRTDHVISIQTDRATTYEAYFRMQSAIVAAYNQLREKYSRERYGKGYGELVQEQRDEINQYYPQRISESKPSTGGAE